MRIPSLDRQTLVSLLTSADFSAVFAEADRLRRENCGNTVQLRALLEFSSYCKRSCSYCGLNCTNPHALRYRMQPDEIVACACAAADAGYRTIVLQSGEDSAFPPDLLCSIVSRIKAERELAVTLSCGEFPPEVYRQFRAAGADRYLLKHETSDAALYAGLHPECRLQSRLDCLFAIKAAGLEVGGGFMIGLPGQTAETIADDLLLLQKIPCDMAGIGPFLPHPDTPLRNALPGSGELTLRAVALARLLLPTANLPATTALGVLDGEKKQNVFSCGANVLMRKITPLRYRKMYEIYPAQLPETDIPEGRAAAESEIKALGRTPL